MPAGKLRPKLYGRFALDGPGTIKYEANGSFLGLKGIRENHGCLLIHLIDQRLLKKGLSEFFEKALEFIRVKEFVQSIDVLWHRVKARKAVDALKYSWLSRINLNHGDALNKSISERERPHAVEPSKCEDFENFTYHRRQH